MKAVAHADASHVTRPARDVSDRSSVTPQILAEQGARFVPQTLRYLGVPDSVLLDAAQDVFLVALRKMGDFEGRSSLQTWLYGICIRVAHGYRRRSRSSRETLVDSMPELTTPAAQEAAIENVEWQRRLAELLDRLDEPQREVFVLFEIQHLTMKQVSEIVGCPLPTAYFRLKAARTKVLEAFRSGSEAEPA